MKFQTTFGDIEVDGDLFSLTDLQKCYNDIARTMSLPAKRFEDLMRRDLTIFVSYFSMVTYDVKCIRGISFEQYKKEANSSSLTKLLKKLGMYKTVGCGKNRKVFCFTAIWLCIALQLHPILFDEGMLFLKTAKMNREMAARTAFLEFMNRLSKKEEDKDE